MSRDPNNILTWDIWDMDPDLNDIPSPNEIEEKICPDCKGKKVIYLLTSYQECTLCKGLGKILLIKHKKES